MTAIASPEPRNTERCPQCGYSLQGHPESGQCPECGQSYDQSLVVIDGWSASGDAMGNPFLARHPAVLIQMLLACAAIGILLYFRLAGIAKWIALLPVAVPIACAVARRHGDDTPPLQLVLASGGQIHRYHPAAAGRAMTLNRVSAVAAFAPMILLIVQRRSGIGLVYLGAYVLSIPVTAIWYRLKWRRSRRVVAQVSGQGIALIPWGPNDEIILTPIRPDTLRIAVRYKPERRRSFRLTSDHNKTIRFEADLSNDRVEHIAAQMASWPIKLTVSRKLPKPRWWQRLTRSSHR